jgi:hypothetical protein
LRERVAQGRADAQPELRGRGIDCGDLAGVPAVPGIADARAAVRDRDRGNAFGIEQSQRRDAGFVLASLKAYTRAATARA